MQIKQIKRLVRVWAAPVAVLALVGFAAGCGGGGGDPVNPVATPSPSASAIVGVTARQVSNAPGSDPNAAVQWSAPTFTPTTNVVEYHVYRNNVLVGVVSRRTFIYYDALGESFAGGLTYYTINAKDNTKLNLVTAPTPPALVSAVPVTYRVTALYATPETAASATPEYAEAEIGTSSSIVLL